jgi:hypothetical protein
MIISDLNYMEKAEASVVGSSGVTYYQNDVNLGLTLKLTKVAVFIKGNQADASADALALGYDTYTKSSAVTFTTPISSASSSFSQSATA